MKVSIGAFIKSGPWGGGNLFFENLKHYLESNNHHVINHLYDEDIDVILLTDPRKESESSSFTHIEIKRYKKRINPNVKVMHRINECDERKNTQGLNQFIYEANKVADASVLVSNWLKNLYIQNGFNLVNPSVIMSGSNSKIFNNVNKTLWNGSEKISIVTHHWGGNWNKGFDVYQNIDKLLENREFNNNFEFKYIGNLPKNFKFKNTKFIKPLSGEQLSNELKKSHVYITGSLNEPSGNHHIEAALCGLPVLYINSGALPEYCNGYGIEFNLENLEEKIYEMKINYFEIVKKLMSYPYESNFMCSQYEDLMNDLKNMNTNIKQKNFELSILDKITLVLKRVTFLNMYNLFRRNKLWK